MSCELAQEKASVTELCGDGIEPSGYIISWSSE